MVAATSLTQVDTSNPLAKYQASSTTTKASNSSDEALQKLSSDYTTFLKLLTTQLQNQDPTAPMDSAQFTQQLVQYSQVEQQIKSNQKLDALINSQKSTGIGSSLGYLGKTVEMDAPAFTADASGGSFNYTLSDVAKSVTVKIYDENGNLVRTTTDASGSLGKHTLAWDGKDDSGKLLAHGLYSVSITATNSKGEAVNTKVTTNGKVSGVEKDSSGNIMLNVGKLQISPDSILSIHETTTAALGTQT